MSTEAGTGFCVWLMGLSGAGKSTIASCLNRRLERQGRLVTVLDGDVVRTNLSQGLGFSKEDRDANVRRIGFVASEIVRHGGAVVVAAISPHEGSRREARTMVTPERFLLALVDTSLEVCEARDVKSLYAKARRGEIAGMTGIDDPYERPIDPDVVLDTLECTADECAALIEQALVERGHLADRRRQNVVRRAGPWRVA
jgi:sulfate adenylyltransferase